MTSRALRIAEQWFASDVGRQRQGNEDNLFVRAPLYVVADGMGGAQGGEVASEIAVRTFERGTIETSSPEDSLVDLIHAANRRIYELSRSESGREGMGTTLTAAYVDLTEVIVAHVGDSRAYCYRNGELLRITTDHSLVGELVARGKLTEQEAEVHPQRSVITRALGPEEFVEPDIDRMQAQSGDIFLLCSDGLTSMVHDSVIATVLSDHDSVMQSGRRLIEVANEAGGRDNITVLLFRLEAFDVPASAPRPSIADDVHFDDEGVLRDATVVSEPPSAAIRESSSQALKQQRPGPRRIRRVIFRSSIALLLLAVCLMGGWSATRAIYFMGTDSDDGGAVAIYRGLPYELPGKIKLYERFVPSGVTFEQVPPNRRSAFTDHKLRTRKDAESLLIALERGELT